MAQYEKPPEVEESPPFKWPDGKRVALCLTFDDARFSQIDIGLPLFEKYNVRITFYISPWRVLQRLDEWKKVALKGHEIGNHTVSHPCTGNFPFSLDNALENYTLAKMTDEMDNADQFILEQIGVKAFSFAYPCGQKFVGRGENVQSYVPLVAKKYITGRGWLGENSNDPWFCDFAQLLAIESDGKTFEQLKFLVDEAAQNGRWLILAGHEINSDGVQTTLVQTLEELFQYAQDPQRGIWIDTVTNIANFIKEHRE